MTDVAARPDPLFDALFRPTSDPVPANTGIPDLGRLGAAPAVLDPSAAPARPVGTRARAGNAMNRTRAALLDGAARAVAASGTSITMAQVAALAGVAKATLYNHFRTKDAVLAALATAEVEALAAELDGLTVRQALVEAAAVVVTHPALATLREREPAVLAAALGADDAPPAMTAARTALVGVLTAAGLVAEARDVAADLLLRWLVSLALAPAAPADVLAAVDVLLAGLLV